MDAYAWDPTVKQKLVECTTDHRSFRAACGFSPQTSRSPDISIAWRATLPRSADLFLSLIEAAIFNWNDANMEKTIVAAVVNLGQPDSSQNVGRTRTVRKAREGRSHNASHAQ